jgi:hypothetical protein
MKFAAKLFVAGVISMLCVGCCGDPDYQTRFVDDKTVFINRVAAHQFKNEQGETRTLKNDLMECDVSEYSAPDNNCIAYNNELCGQAFYESKDKNNPLDFTIVRTYTEMSSFLFSDSYAQEVKDGDFVELDSIEIDGHLYNDVIQVNLRPRLVNASLSTLIYSSQSGPLRFEMSNGEVWTRVFP